MPALSALPSNEAMDSSKERLNNGEAFTSQFWMAAWFQQKRSWSEE
jgi:hypothetical protein